LGAFFVMSISAWYLLKDRHQEFARKSFSGGLLIATIFSLAQLVSGHLQAENVAEHQPAKLAAFEGQYRTESHAPLYFFGWPDDETETVKYGLGVPGMLSWLIHGEASAEVRGFDQLEKDYGRPPVWLTFQAYHIMVAIGMFFIALTSFSCFAWWRGTLFRMRWLLWIYVFAVFLAFVANELGWVAAEVGRQPWIVYPSIGSGGELVGGLRTSDGLSESVTAELVLGSLIMFGLLYGLLFALWVFLLNYKIQAGPAPHVSADTSSTSPRDYARAAAPPHGLTG